MNTGALSILFIDQYPYVGGGQTVLLSLLQEATLTFGKVGLMAPLGGSLEKSVRQRFGGSVVLHAIAEPRLTQGRKGPMDALRLLLYSFGSLRQLRVAASYDRLYVNGSRQMLAGMLLSVLTNRLTCYHVHLNYGAAERRLLAWAARLRQTFRIVTISSFVHDRLMTGRPGLAATGKIILIENALPEQYVACTFQDRFSATDSALRIAVVGTLTPAKGQDVAVCAAGRVPGACLHVIGATGRSAEAWTAALRLQAPATVTFHGATDDVPALLDSLGIQVCVVPSRWEEPFGLAALEGMACSCITLVSGTGGLAEIAARTSAVICGNADVLAIALNGLAAMRPHDLVALARRQFEATQTEYAPGPFAEKTNALFRALSHAM